MGYDSSVGRPERDFLLSSLQTPLNMFAPGGRWARVAEGTQRLYL